MTEEALEEKPVETQDTTQQEDDKEKNWKAFVAKRKEEQEELRKQNEKNLMLEQENSRKAKEIEDMKVAISALLEKNNGFDDEDEIKKKIESEVDKIYSKREEERLKREAQARYEYEARMLRESMPDIQEVCSTENLLYLEFHHPEIAIPISKMPQGYERTKCAYDAVKKHVKMGKKEEKQIEKNMSKPKSVHSTLSNESQQEEGSYVMSDKKRQEVWNKMQRLISGQDDD